jgi:hypothetical protein
MATLSPDEIKTAKRLAKEVIGSSTEAWSAVGHDRREKWCESLLTRLRESENTQIASVLSTNKALAHKILQEKVKSMRKRKKEPE